LNIYSKERYFWRPTQSLRKIFSPKVTSSYFPSSYWKQNTLHL